MTTVEGRRRGRPGYDVESLLQAAADLFFERGYDGTSMDELSRRLGVTKSAICHHVRGKEELLRRSVDRALDGLFATAQHVERTGGPAIERLERLTRESVKVLTEQLPFVTVLLRVHGNSGVEREALARRREFDDLVAGLVRQAQADGDIRADLEPTITARLLFGMVNSLIDWYRPGRGANGAELADAVVAVAFDGIRTGPAPLTAATRLRS
jgi:AcrR family transcriptional regulator